MSFSEALVPVIDVLTLTDANTEYSQTLGAKCKYFSFQARTSVEVRYAFESVSADVALATGPYMTLKSDGWLNAPEKMGWGKTNPTETLPKIYFATGTAGTVIEILSWEAG